MKYFSCFSGIGGFELGIQNAFTATRLLQRHNNDDSPTADVAGGVPAEPLCVGYSEIDKYAITVYQRHFPEHEAYGDITKIDTTNLPDFDLLVGGFPCQAFSVAGKRGGFEDTRGTLFFELARILKDKQPGYFVFENVKGLISHDAGRTFRTIIETLDGIGYDLQWQVLNSKFHGVPQNRERIFIVGNFRGRARPEVFPFADADGQDTRIIGQDVAYTIDANYAKGTNTLEKSRRSVVANYAALTERRTEEAKKLRRLGIVKDTRNLKKLTPREDGIANTVTTGDIKNQSLTNGAQIRRLTPLECERLQAFPDGWTQFGKDGELISDTQRYKMCGNAVTVNVITDIFTKFFQSIKGA